MPNEVAEECGSALNTVQDAVSARTHPRQGYEAVEQEEINPELDQGKNARLSHSLGYYRDIQ